MKYNVDELIGDAGIVEEIEFNLQEDEEFYECKKCGELFRSWWCCLFHELLTLCVKKVHPDEL